MWSLTRQERILLFSLVVILGIGTGLIALKRSFGIDLFGIHERSDRVELKGGERTLLLFVKGAVEDPGIYQLPMGSRIIEAVQKARPSPQADLMSLSLADFVKDGQTIVVPHVPLPQDRISGVEMRSSTRLFESRPSASASKINLNTADTLELDSLPGIGPELASRMIRFRKDRPFVSIEDLLKVPGIGRKKFDEIKDKVRVE